MKKLRSKLTYGNAVATLALFIAVGGGTAYAMEAIPPNSVGTEQLKSSAVIAAKIKDGSVNSAKLAPNSVTEAAIAKGAVATNKLPTGAVINSKIAAGAVDSASVADGSLSTADLATKPVLASGSSEAKTPLSEECTHYEGGQVTIIVPSSGTVSVSGNVDMETNHTSGDEDAFLVGLAPIPTLCYFGIGEPAEYSISGDEAEYSVKRVTMPVEGIFTVGPGSHTFYLNGFEVGPDREQFYYAGLTAIFIPN